MSVWYDKKRKHWIAKFWHQKDAYRRGAFKSRSAAKLWEAETLAALMEPPPAATVTISLLELANRYLDHCYATFRENTCRAKASYYKRFFAFLGNADMPVESVPKNAYAQFLDRIATQEGKKKSNRFLKDFKAMFNWGVHQELIVRNPCIGIEPKGEDRFVKYVPPSEDIHRIMMAAGQEEGDLLTTLYCTGCRIGEALNLTWDDINLEQRSITLRTRKRKGGGLEPDTLAMPEKLHGAMKRRWQNRNKLSPHVFCKEDGTKLSKGCHWVRNMMPKLCRRAGVKPFGFHAIRHRIAATLLDSGKATLGQIQEFLRHNRKTTTETYLQSLDRTSSEVAAIIDSEVQKMSR